MYFLLHFLHIIVELTLLDCDFPLVACSWLNFWCTCCSECTLAQNILGGLAPFHFRQSTPFNPIVQIYIIFALYQHLSQLLKFHSCWILANIITYMLVTVVSESTFALNWGGTSFDLDLPGFLCNAPFPLAGLRFVDFLAAIHANLAILSCVGPRRL